MPDEIPLRAIERGEGFWCYYTPKPDPAPAPIQPNGGDLSDAATFDEQLVYRPVTVDINDDGEAYAYFYDEDADWEDLEKRGGKVFVPPRQVYAEPLPGAEPWHEHKPDTPEDDRRRLLNE